MADIGQIGASMDRPCCRRRPAAWTSWSTTRVMIRRAEAIDIERGATGTIVVNVNLTSLPSSACTRPWRGCWMGAGPRRQDHQRGLHAVLPGRRPRAVVHGVQERRNGADQGPGQRVGRARHQRQRHRAWLYGHQQHGGAAGRRGAQRGHHGAHPGRPLGQACGHGGAGGLPRLAARPTTSMATRWPWTAAGWRADVDDATRSLCAAAGRHRAGHAGAQPPPSAAGLLLREAGPRARQHPRRRRGRRCTATTSSCPARSPSAWAMCC